MSIDKKIDLALIIKAVIVFLITSFLSVLLFAVGMFYLEGGYQYSPLYATISVAVGCFLTSFYLGSKLQKNGMIIGLLLGALIFTIITLITFLFNKGGVSINILLRLIILILSSMIGAVIGVNRNFQQKYI